jgi:RNA polymerase sigma-70 factor (ECF subfamily)
LEKEKEVFLEGLFRKMYKPLYDAARSRIGDSHRAEELTQDVFVIASGKIDAVMGSPNPGGWLYVTLQNVLRHEFRTRQLVQQLFVPIEVVPEPIDSGKSNDADIEILEIRNLFEPEEWALLKKAYIDDVPIKVIAQELGIGYDACKKRLYKARDRARVLLKEEI